MFDSRLAPAPLAAGPLPNASLQKGVGPVLGLTVSLSASVVLWAALLGACRWAMTAFF